MKPRSTELAAPAVWLAVAIASCGVHHVGPQPPDPRALQTEAGTSETHRPELPRADVERAIADAREKAIADYEKILARYADVGRDEMDEALYHLEHLLFERERQASEQAYEETRTQAEAAGAPVPAPKPRYPAARALCERLLREFPNSSLFEDALYDLGYMRFEEGDRAAAAVTFESLVRSNPRSRYAVEAHFRIAGMGLQAGDTQVALTGVLMDGTAIEGSDEVCVK